MVAPDSNSSFVTLILSVSVILMFDRALYKGAGRSADPPPLIRTRTNSFFWAFFTVSVGSFPSEIVMCSDLACDLCVV